MDNKAIITEAAQRYGIDPNIALGIAYIESKFIHTAQNPHSSAGGLFQFIDSTWASYGQGKNRKDAYANADAGMRFLRDNANILKRRLGREPTGGELYLAHQQGAGGALKILSNPNGRAVDIVGGKAVRLNAGNDSMTGQQFAGLWTSKFDDALTKIGAPAEARVQGMAPPASMGRMTESDYSTDDQGKVSFTDVAPTLGITDEQRREQEDAAEGNKYGLFEGAKAAIGNEWAVLSPFRALGKQEPDYDFNLNQENLTKLAEGIPNQYVGEFSDAVSEDHALAIRERLLKQMDTNEKLGNMGWTGTALSVGAAFTDPAAIAATLAISAATGGTGFAPAVAARLGKVGTIGLAAAEGAVGNIAVDIPLVAVDPTRDASSLKWSAGAGLIMGGAFGALRKNPYFVEEADQLTRIGKSLQEDAVASQVAAVAGRNDSINAASVLRDASYRSDTDTLDAIYSDIGKDISPRFGDARFDVEAQLLRSKNPMTRVIARYLGEDAVRAGDGQVTPIAATEVQSRLNRAATANWSGKFNSAWDNYRASRKIGKMKEPEAFAQFKGAVSDYIGETDPTIRAQAPKDVREAAETFAQEMRNYWQKATDAGLPRSENGVENYFPRYPNLTAASNLIDKYGYSRDPRNGGLASVYRDAIVSAQPKIDPALADKMGYAMVDRMMKLKAGENLLDSKLGSNSLDDLEDILGSYLAPDEVSSIRRMMEDSTPASERGAHGGARLKHRVMFDENHKAMVKNRYTGQMEEVRLKDFYIRDPDLAFKLYSRNMSGNIAMAQIKIKDPVTGELLVDGIRSSGEWNTFLEQVKGVGDKHGANTKEDLDNLNFLYSAVTGAPVKGIDETGSVATWLRMIRDYNFARLMGQVGIAQLPEIGRTASVVGLKAMYAGVPSFRGLMRLARTGKAGDELTDEMVALGGFGMDHARSRHFTDMDDFGTPLSMGSDSFTNRANNKVAPKLHGMTHFVSKYSGMAPINALYQTTTSRAIAVHFAQMAVDGAKVNTKRMRALGLTDADFNDITAAIRQHAKFRGGVVKGTRLEALGLDKWDGNIAAKMEAAIYRGTRALILENDAGQMFKSMLSPVGKAVLQFRTFSITAWTKATLQGLNMRDVEAALGFLTTTFIGALTYVGQTHLNLIGDADRDAKLEERLSWTKLGMAGFQRSSEASLMPMITDTIASTLTGETVFDYRTTGLSSNAIFGNPTFDLIDSVQKGVSGAMTAIGGDDYSSQDYKAGTRALPFQRLLGITQIINWLGSDLTYEQRD